MANDGSAPMVYPRPRGGAQGETAMSYPTLGLSPPARGSRQPFPVSHSPTRVYPRPRGGARLTVQAEDLAAGLSPPARGSLLFGSLAPTARGSIPARAGEPHCRSPVGSQRRVYPRPRGGAPRTPVGCALCWGLSPPARGSPDHPYPITSGGRSIPARAGEPSTCCFLSICLMVYPRPRGGAGEISLSPAEAQGLSPPARGSPFISQTHGLQVRSIPARAGEPRPCSPLSPLSPVYPRPRGGADRQRTNASPPSGLSPPARGSLLHRNRLPMPSGSIPARAGEPLDVSEL